MLVTALSTNKSLILSLLSSWMWKTTCKTQSRCLKSSTIIMKWSQSWMSQQEKMRKSCSYRTVCPTTQKSTTSAVKISRKAMMTRLITMKNNNLRSPQAPLWMSSCVNYATKCRKSMTKSTRRPWTTSTSTSCRWSACWRIKSRGRQRSCRGRWPTRTS